MDELTTLRAEGPVLASLPIKERRKQAKKLGYLALSLEASGALEGISDIDLALNALAAGAQAHYSSQRLHMCRAKLLKRRRQVLKLPEPEIQDQKAKTLDIEAGGVWVQDASLPFETPAKTPFHQHLNETGSYFVSFGGDGAVKIRLRLHRFGPCGPQSKEFRRLREATPEASLALSTGLLRVYGGGVKKLDMAVPNGAYKIAAYGLGIGRSPECLILISPMMGDDPPEALTDTPELQL